MPKNKGTKGQGESKSIAWREERKKVRTMSKKSSPKTESGALDQIILTTSDFLNGHTVTGHYVAIGDAVFEVKKETLLLSSARCEQLAQFVSRMRYVFVAECQLTSNTFESSLSHTAREKQMAMWNYIRTVIGEEGRTAILKRRWAGKLMISDRQMLSSTKEVKPLPSSEKLLHVGENAKRWNEASSEIATAFESMSTDKPAEIRIGTNQHEGITLGFFYKGNGNIHVYAGHTGAKSPLTGKVLEGAFLEVRHGQLNETISETLNATERGRSAFAMHGFLMGLPRNLRDPIMHGMHHAVRRIKDEEEGFPRPSHPPVLQVVKNTAQEAPPQKVPATPSKDGLQELVDALVKSDATPELIVQVTRAYQASQASAASGSKAA